MLNFSNRQAFNTFNYTSNSSNPEFISDFATKIEQQINSLDAKAILF
jgi:hypothetical protein